MTKLKNIEPARESPESPPTSINGPVCLREVRYKGITYAPPRRLPDSINDEPETLARLAELGAI